MSFASIPHKVAEVIGRVEQAAQNSGRTADEITLLAVSKKHPASAIRQAHQAGLVHFGENYLNEALEKQQLLKDLPLCWHFIGPIQSNKTRAIANHFDWVHSVDRLKIARRLSEQRPDTLPALNICLQVNISGEASKSGALVEQVNELALAINDLPRLTLRGLMAIPAPCTDPAQQRIPFAALRQMLEQLRTDLPALDALSMGMSGDMGAAIAEGATIVRVGTALFGPRADHTPASILP